MLFSKQQLETAISYMSVYFDKVLYVDFNTDTFRPIKVNNTEWNKIQKKIKFSEWLSSFLYSEEYKPINDGNTDDLVDLLDLEGCKNRKKVLICNYYKRIDNQFHIVQLEMYPIGNGFAYLFVRDITKMQEEIKVVE